MTMAAAAVLAACSQGTEPVASDAWIRLPAVPGRPGAAYVTIHGGTAPATLIGARTPAAGRTELHETVPGGMRPRPAVPLPAGADTRFQPGGLHVMLFQLDPGVTPGSSTRLELKLADGRTLATDARVIGPADPAP